MKSFLKKIAASCLGTLGAFFFIAILAIMVIAIISNKESSPNKGILHIPLDGQITDFSQNSFNLSQIGLSTTNTSLWELRNKISAASKDKKIKAIFLEIKNPKIGQAAATELMEYFEMFKQGGKKIYTYGDYFEQNSYLLSLASDSIFLNPNGGVNLKGYAIYAPFFKSILDKFNIDVNVFYAGKYKGTTEPYRSTEFSEENKYQLRKYLTTLHNRLIYEIASKRNIQEPKVQSIINEHVAYDSEYMLKRNIIDRTLFYDEFESILERDFNTKSLVPLKDYKPKRKKAKGDKIAVVFAEGDINWGYGSAGSIGHQSFIKEFRKIRENKKIKAVIVRLNSPGGNGFASDLLHREIELTKKAGKKVYASFGSIATSGAYYMAAACDSIFTSSNSLTGSIGVYIMLPTADQFINEQLEINLDSVASSENAIPYTMAFPINEAEQKRLKDHTNRLYQQFIRKVSEGRSIEIDSVHEIAQGRLWTGKDAVEIGLADEIKTLEEIILFVKSKSGFEDLGLAIYPEQKMSFSNEILANRMANSKLLLNNEISKYIDFQSLMLEPQPLMKIPTYFNVTNQ